MTDLSTMVNDAAESFQKMVSDLFKQGKGLVEQTIGTIPFPAPPGCSCARPGACWLPEILPPVTDAVCPGAIARVRFVVHNCGLATRTVLLAATGPDAAQATGSPSTVTIEPFGEGVLVAAVTAPSTGELSLTLWVRGCHDHITTWTVKVDEKGCGTTHEVCVEDCPDTQHHWYDHFAQPKPCSTGFQRG